MWCGDVTYVWTGNRWAHPSIYKVGAIKRIGQEPKGIPHTFYFDDLGRVVERKELKSFENDEPVFDAMKEAASEINPKNNLTDEYFTDSGIDTSNLTEAFLLQDTFAVVCYHFRIPSISSPSIPLDFTTTDKKVINSIETHPLEYSNGIVSHEKPIYLGKFRVIVNY